MDPTWRRLALCWLVGAALVANADSLLDFENPCGVLPDDLPAEQNNAAPLSWVVRINYPSSDRRDAPVVSQCTGTLIDRRHVLTAAHCVLTTRPPCSVEVRHCTAGSPDCPSPSTTVHIERLAPHPAYSINNRGNDIAIIRLAQNVDFTTTGTRPVCLFNNGQLPVKDDPARQLYFVSGFGIHRNGSKKSRFTNTELRTITVPVMDEATCQPLLDRALMVLDPLLQVCAGGLGREPCLGDGGAPIHAVVNQRLYQVGLVSVGPQQCGDGGLPTVYTRIATQKTWIQDTLASLQIVNY